jgi:hypothetical protein
MSEGGRPSEGPFWQVELWNREILPRPRPLDERKKITSYGDSAPALIEYVALYLALSSHGVRVFIVMRYLGS